jgi:hypothetical protein
MEIKNDEKFIKNVEALIDPVEVHNLYFFQKFRKLLPKKLFKRILVKTSSQVPHMGFVIEPYSLFLFFKLKDIEKAKALLPDRYELKKTRIFADDEPDYYLGMGNLYTRASTFWGIRLECYLIAEDKITGHPSWIFIDILSNTIMALPSEGIADPNSKDAVFTTNSKGEVILDIREDGTSREIILKGNIKRGKIRKLYQPIWLMGNTSIAHSKDISGYDDKPFTVIFDPSEVEEALDIPIEDITIKKNTLFPGFAEQELSKVACFPYAQHYIADSPGVSTHIKDREDLISRYNKITETNNRETFSTKSIRKLFFVVSPVISFILITLLILFGFVL